MYVLGLISKGKKTVYKVSREEIRRFDRYKAQAEYVELHRIDTQEELDKRIDALKSKIEHITKKRINFNSKKKKNKRVYDALSVVESLSDAPELYNEGLSGVEDEYGQYQKSMADLEGKDIALLKGERNEVYSGIAEANRDIRNLRKEIRLCEAIAADSGHVHTLLSTDEQLQLNKKRNGKGGMTMNGDAADEVVRMMINGTEMAVRLTGSAAKNLAAILVAWSKKEKKVYGKTTIMKLLKSGEPLQVLPMTREQYSRFKSMARRKVLYAPFLNTKVKNDKVDVVISEKSLPMVNYILKASATARWKKNKRKTLIRILKKDTQSRQSSEDARASSEVHRDTQAPKSRENKASVREQLEQNRKQLLKKEQRHPQKVRSKKRPKSKER